MVQQPKMVWLPEKERERERERERESKSKGEKLIELIILYLQNNLNSMSFKSLMHLHRKGMATIHDHNLVKNSTHEDKCQLSYINSINFSSMHAV